MDPIAAHVTATEKCVKAAVPYAEKYSMRPREKRVQSTIAAGFRTVFIHVASAINCRVN